MDARHEKRIKLVQNIFSLSFQNSSGKNILPNKELAADTEKITLNQQEIDKMIATYAPKYPLDKIAKTDLCILRLAVYEICFEKKEPVKVVINEAVELAKELGNERSFAFVNAVLGAIVKVNGS